MKRYPKYKDSGIEWLGEIPEGWEVRRLKWIASLEYGSSLSEDDREEGDVPVYGSNGIVGKHSKSITGSPALIIGRKGSYGKVSYSEIPCFPIDTTYYIDPRLAKENIRWLYYLLSSMNLDEITFDTGVPGLSREFAYSKIVPLPTPKEQTTIATFLDRQTSKIDELIKKNERLIELLKEKRQAVISHAVTKGLDPNAKMKDSGIEWLGEIPEGWEVKRLKWLVSLEYGSSLNEEDRDEGDVPVYGSNGIVGKHSKNTTGSPAIIIGRKGSYGKVSYSEIPCFPIDTTYYIDPSLTKENIRWLYYLLGSIALDEITFDTGVPGLSREFAYTKIVPVPSKNEQTAIIDATVQKIQSQIATLKEYRQTLISNVVTGKVRIDEN